VFGYVNPDKPELKLREYEVYKAYYCAVCKAVGRNSGQAARLSLSYDLSFLALLLDALDPVPDHILRERCVAHPTRRHAVIAPDPAVFYAADMNVLLAYYNLRDKWIDEHSLPGAAGTLMLARAARKAGTRWPEQAAGIRARLAELQELEAAGCGSVDEAAEPFARIMEILFGCPLVKDAATRKGLAWLGYNIGRWIYLVDALDDLEDDRRNGSYNPLLKQYGLLNEPIAEFMERNREQMEFALLYSLSEADKALKVLDIRKNREILENVIEAGLIRKTDDVLNKGGARPEDGKGMKGKQENQ
jgi:hypothetical protein